MIYSTQVWQLLKASFNEKEQFRKNDLKAKLEKVKFDEKKDMNIIMTKL